MDNLAALPADLSNYKVIWDVSFSPLSASEQTQIINFLISGHGVHFSGEKLGYDSMNASFQYVINNVLSVGGVNVGVTGGQPLAPFAFNGSSIDGITSTPNLLSSWIPQIPGGMSGNITSAHVLATGGGMPVGAAWDEHDMSSGKGRLSILMDGDWLSGPGEKQAVENLQVFLSVPEPTTLLLAAAAALFLLKSHRPRGKTCEVSFPIPSILYCWACLKRSR